jgi:hypothetical protein
MQLAGSTRVVDVWKHGGFFRSDGEDTLLFLYVYYKKVGNNYGIPSLFSGSKVSNFKIAGKKIPK